MQEMLRFAGLRGDGLPKIENQTCTTNKRTHRESTATAEAVLQLLPHNTSVLLWHILKGVAVPLGYDFDLYGDDRAPRVRVLIREPQASINELRIYRPEMSRLPRSRDNVSKEGAGGSVGGGSQVPRTDLGAVEAVRGSGGN